MALLEPPQNVLRFLHGALPEDFNNQENDGREEILSYVAFLAAGLAEANEYDSQVWRDILEPYLSQSERQISSNNGAVIENFRTACVNAFTVSDDAESYGGDDDDAEELCDLRFNLAYGGKILLHQTKLRLLRGRRYALVGQNGVGKTVCIHFAVLLANSMSFTLADSLSFCFLGLFSFVLRFACWVMSDSDERYYQRQNRRMAQAFGDCLRGFRFQR